MNHNFLDILLNPCNTLLKYWKLTLKAAKMPKNGKKKNQIGFYKNLFFPSTFKAKLRKKIQNSETTFSKQFCPNFFLMFSMLSSKIEH